MNVSSQCGHELDGTTGGGSRIFRGDVYPTTLHFVFFSELPPPYEIENILFSVCGAGGWGIGARDSQVLIDYLDKYFKIFLGSHSICIATLMLWVLVNL